MSTTDDPLRPTVCPRCEYALTGLPAVGVCPECGHPYDGDTVYLYGHAAGGRAQAWNGPVWSFRGLAFSWGMVVVWTAILGIAWRSGGLLLRGPMVQVLFPLTTVIAATWRRTTSAGGPLVRVRLAMDGIGQIDRSSGPLPFDPDDATQLVPWRKVVRIRLVTKPGGRLRITLSNNDDWWRFRTDYVDAVVKCDPEVVATLRERIAKWRGMPNGPISPGRTHPGFRWKFDVRHSRGHDRWCTTSTPGVVTRG